MKKKLCLLMFLVFSIQAFAQNEIKNVGISKYAVLEVKEDNTPLRDNPNEDAKRITHAFQDTVLFADKQNDKYYRVELKNNEYAWINKNQVEVQAIIPEKRFDNIEKISFKNNKKSDFIKIEIPFLSAYKFKEEKNNNLTFTLYDNRFDPTEINFKNNEKNVEIPNLIKNELEISFKNEYLPFGYDVTRTDKGYLVNVKKAPKINSSKPLKRLIVTVDAGHGGIEKGACAFGYEEKTINLQISKKLKRELKRRGAKVYLTRTKDKQVGLYERIEFAKEKQSDILISIHQNSLPNIKDIDKKYGVGTYYYNNEAKPLAQSIQNSLIQATNFKDDKVNYASFALTRPTLPVSVLVECGYIIKQDEAEKLANKKFQKIIAKAIVEGTENYLIDNYKNYKTK